MTNDRQVITVWVHHHGGSGTEPLMEQLTSRGIRLVERSPETERFGGLFIVDAIDTQALELLRAYSKGGRSRVFALGMGGELLRSEHLWAVLASGASDAGNWNSGLLKAEDLTERFRRWEDIETILRSPLVANNLVGSCSCWHMFLRRVIEAACYSCSSILLSGQSGTGKELLARLIHTLDRREDKGELIVLDCTTIQAELSGSEFFGHEKGSFTGAISRRDGAFALADKGTLFLDEISELPLPLQAKLLRVIQEGSYKRIGGNTWHETNFRLLCATNRDLDLLMEEGLFRRDLYYRIATWTANVPPLSDRREDIPELVRYFARQLCADGKDVCLDAPVEQYLFERVYHGNVRELRQVISRIMLRHVGGGAVTVGTLDPDDVPRGDAKHTSGTTGGLEDSVRQLLVKGTGLKEIGKMAENAALSIVLDEENGRLGDAAMRLGLTRRALELRRAGNGQRKPFKKNGGP
ncbi:MAG: sigma 54-interacting transcriptional regulator [Bacteroidia bacterium]|nr:sigma 54-interacting transcriptional regulator [Bacteroidia bacterium]